MAGLAVGFFEAHLLLPVEWRLLVVTGFLGEINHLFHLFGGVYGVTSAGRVCLVFRTRIAAPVRLDYFVSGRLCDISRPHFLIFHFIRSAASA